ncbi:helix-turn-helix domain-containing protein [Comamonadaceae bacterium G21597-S1]|nr:helix-turn-helix domain-containing protein [Comamonadaceae bacterium G21597-S1]
MAEPLSPGTRTGTQSIERTIRLIRAAAERGRTGWQLADLARHTELDKSTVHRILGCLVRERVVSQRQDGRYLPGPLMFELALTMRPYHAFQDLAEQRLSSFARRAQATAAFYLRSGDETVCAASMGGAATQQYMAMSLGSRRPLLASVAGIAILMALPDAEAAAVVARNLDLLGRQRDARTPSYQSMYRASREAGVALHESHHMVAFNGYARAIVDAAGRPFAALSLSGSQEELPTTRRQAIAALLEEEAAALSKEAAAMLGEVD